MEYNFKVTNPTLFPNTVNAASDYKAHPISFRFAPAWVVIIVTYYSTNVGIQGIRGKASHTANGDYMA